VRVAILTFAIVLGASTTAMAEEIREIIVEKNTKTEDDTVALIARIEVGDDWALEKIDEIKGYLVSSGLFKDVNVFSDNHPEGGVRVYIQVTDKHSWVIAPALYLQPTNKGGGVGFGENNLFGQNQKLLLYGQIASGDSFFIGAWVIPSLGGTRFYAQLDTFLKSSRNIEYASPSGDIFHPDDVITKPIRESRIAYLNAGVKLGIELFRGFKFDVRLRGAKVSYSDVKLAEGAMIEEVTGDPTSDPNNVPAPGAEGNDVSTEFSLALDRRANWFGVQTGYKYAVWFETASPGLGSDFRYFLSGLSIFRAKQILQRHNAILKTTFNYGGNIPFQQEYLTGGTSMRGYLNNELRGDFRAIANLEYSFPMFTILGLSVRGLGFVDSAYTTFIETENTQRDYLPDARAHETRGRFVPWRNSVGGGIRLYMRQIVLPLLGVDFGYGLESRDYQIYLAIGLTD
jgi:outer membrane protein insertion porin family